IATCSLHVMWSYPRRSASTTARSISAIPASRSHCACAPGSRVTTGVTIPSFIRVYPLPGSARSRDAPSAGLLLGHQRAVGDDVLLHLGRPRTDRRVTL